MNPVPAIDLGDRRGERSRPFWSAAVAASTGAGIVHLAHAPAPIDELGPLGVGFFLAAALQLGWATAALGTLAGFRTWPGAGAWSRLAVSGLAINGSILAAWAVSRVVGLPAGAAPWTPEAVGMADGISALLEGLLVAGLAAALRGLAMPRPPRMERFATAGAAIAILLIVTGTAVAVGPSEAGHHHPPGYEHAEADAHSDDADAHGHGAPAGT